MVRRRRLDRAGQGRPARRLPCPSRSAAAATAFFEAALVAEQVGPHRRAGAVCADARRSAPCRSPSSAPTSTRPSCCRRSSPGDPVLTAAPSRAGRAAARAPATTATADGDGWRLTGTKRLVPGGAWPRRRSLVPARTGDGDESALFLVDPSAAAVDRRGRRRHQRWSRSHRPPRAGGDAGARARRRRRRRPHRRGGSPTAIAALCATQAGVCEAALRLTADLRVASASSSARKIATFQAVAQRVADAYIDTEAIRLTARQAAWRLGEGLPAAEELHIAKFWAADGGAPRRPRRPAPARRHRRRHRLPAAPLLPLGQGARARPRQRAPTHLPAPSAAASPRRPGVDSRSSGRAREPRRPACLLARDRRQFLTRPSAFRSGGTA